MEQNNESPQSQPTSSEAIWLILSKAETPLDKRLAITDLFVPGKLTEVQDKNKFVGKMAQTIWTELNKIGIIMHPDLERLYLKQETCFWCGGQILKVEGLTPETYEMRCTRCTYLYEEK